MTQLFQTTRPVNRGPEKEKEDPNRKIVLMYSGGLDSLIAYYYLKSINDGNPPILVSCKLGHRYQAKENMAINKIKELTKGEIDPISDYTLDLGAWERSDANIPQRNMLLLMVGSYYGDEVHVVCQKGEQDIPDRSKEFFHSASGMLSFLWGHKIHCSPTFPDNTKTDMVKWYKDNKLPISVLKASVSCYTQEHKLCGECSSCFRRWVALSENGINEKYHKNPWEWKGVESYIKRIKEGAIHKSRVPDIINALASKGIEV